MTFLLIEPTVGNFYTNVTIKAEFDSVVSVLRSRRRRAYAASSHGMVVVVDREADTQDVDVLASLALTLSAALSAPALAVLNHDDDVLLFGLYDNGALVMEYGWTKGRSNEVPPTQRSTFITEVLRRFGTSPRTATPSPEIPGIGIVARILLRVLGVIGSRFMGIAVHQRFVEDTGLPDESIGAGFNYVDRGDFSGSAAVFLHV